MNSHKYMLVLSGIVIILLISCAKDKSIPYIFKLTPPQPVLEKTIGEETVFQIEISGSDCDLQDLFIIQNDDIIGIDTVFETTIHAVSYANDFIYKVKEWYPDSAFIELLFKSANVNGEHLTLVRYIRVHGNTIQLNESQDHVLYSSLSGNPCAFNINMLQPLPAENNPDSILDFADNSVDTLDFPLSREWISPAGLKFAVPENFNYSEVNSSSMQLAYSSGIRSSIIDNLEEDDAVIIGYESGEAIAIIYIKQIIDNVGSSSDRYIFNLKKR